MRKAQLAIFGTFLSIATLGNAYAQPTETIDGSESFKLIPDDVAAPNPKLTDTVDFTQLRNAYGRRSDFQMRCESSRPTKDWVDAMQAQNFNGAYEVITKWFNKCPVDMKVHFWAIDTLKKLGNQGKADAHKRWIFGLTDSIIKSGDGRTPRTAFVTISVSEEYALLTMFRQQRVKQSLVQGPPMVDQMLIEPVGGGGEQQVIYFNPYLHFVRLSHMLDKSKSN
ncbi:hypothetical protein DTO96_101840 [Ephemeroptericola cinctiostellae]|uniref:DUF4919 domain-containing protein n=1 Tax=Ephemeroptericola cinctiostellae TaxID=2268024 RepID=A0A345DCL1_9BURK|nr:DUF4919 domain-containing protein [Ephemeroptericola cinctiostellae]AXF86099.1 hypothetical protein DTO96_101840 [Ephemeroptericola cinctiostellae]